MFTKKSIIAMYLFFLFSFNWKRNEVFFFFLFLRGRRKQSKLTLYFKGNSIRTKKERDTTTKKTGWGHGIIEIQGVQKVFSQIVMIFIIFSLFFQLQLSSNSKVILWTRPFPTISIFFLPLITSLNIRRFITVEGKFSNRIITTRAVSL